jgi:hypothetical protein
MILDSITVQMDNINITHVNDTTVHHALGNIGINVRGRIFVGCDESSIDMAIRPTHDSDIMDVVSRLIDIIRARALDSLSKGLEQAE